MKRSGIDPTPVPADSQDMHKKLAAILLASAQLLAACAASGDGIRTTEHTTSSPKPWAYDRASTEHVLAGETSERFELRHGDCGGIPDAGGWEDCGNDRQRTERVSDWSRSTALYYAFSVYLPEDFADISPANQSLAQVKVKNWRHPVWMLEVKDGALKFEMNAVGRRCPGLFPLEEMHGRWTRIVIYANYGAMSEGSDGPDGDFAAIWINGARKPCHALHGSLTDRNVRRELADKGSSFRYGLYHSYVSRFLARHGTKKPDVAPFLDRHVQEGTVSRSAAQRPFDHDWGIRLPTQVIWFDAISIGGSWPERN